MTLQACIENRPAEGEAGYSKTFEKWVRGIPVRSCSDDEDIECTTDNDCPTSSTCEITSYDEGFAIDDPADEDQCRNARQSLNFDEDYIIDSDVCDDFEARKCSDTFFDTIDSFETEILVGKTIEYTPPK